MLIAKNQVGELLNLLDYTKKELKERSKQSWYCCACGTILVLKNGAVKQTHFAHKSLAECAAFSEGETPEHLLGKKVIAEWCQLHQIDYQVEAYLPKLQQRPDILIAGKWAIEFQCSSLPLQRLKERTENYQKHGYQVIWLLGQKFHLKNKLTSLQKAFLNYTSKIGFYSWELAVETATIQLNCWIEELQGTKEILMYPKNWLLTECTPQEVLDFPESAQIFIYRNYPREVQMKKRLFDLEQSLYRKNPQLLNLQAWLYQKGHHLQELDSVFFLLNSTLFYGNGSSLWWTFLFWEGLIEMSATCRTISRLKKYFLEKISQEKLPLFILANISIETYIMDFLNRYLMELELFDYLDVRKSQLFIKEFPQFFRYREEREAHFEMKFQEMSRLSATPLKNMIR